MSQSHSNKKSFYAIYLHKRQYLSPKHLGLSKHAFLIDILVFCCVRRALVQNRK